MSAARVSTDGTVGRGLARLATRAGKAGAAVAAVAAALVAGCGDAVTLLGLNGPDATPQSIVLEVRVVGMDGADLSWTSAGSGLAYQVQRNGAAVSRTSGLQFADRSLQTDQRYCYRIYAYSGFGPAAHSNEVCIGTSSGTDAWRIEEIAPGRLPAVAVDAGGNVHVCLNRLAGGIDYLQVAPGRTPLTIDADGLAQCAIAVDRSGVVHVAHLSRFGLRHASNGSGTWVVTTVDAQARAGVQRFDGPALVLSVEGVPRIAYRRTAGSGASTIAVATRTATGWSFELTGLAGLVGPRSLAIDDTGRSRLALTDELGQSAAVWVRDSASWTRLYTQSLAPTRGDGPPLLFDASARSAIVWWSRPAFGAATTTSLRLAEDDAVGTWRSEVVETVPDVGFRVAVVDGGEAGRVVASVSSTGQVRVATRGADGWTTELLEEQGATADSLDLAVAPDGEWRLVYGQPLVSGVAAGQSLSGVVRLASRRR